jgi:8-oxo-dGTP diphosphatase
VINKKNLWLPVVTGLIRKNGLVLVGQRPPNDSLPGLWEFPGGKIEAGETPVQALKRELFEELAIDAEIGPLRLAHTHHFEKVHILILFYDVFFWKGEPKPKHHLMLEWIKPQELAHRSIPEANLKILPDLFKILESKRVF